MISEPELIIGRKSEFVKPILYGFHNFFSEQKEHEMYERYCELRDAKRMKDSDVARLSGVSKSTFSDWKSGRSNPKPDKMQKIADALGVQVSYFYEEEGHYIDPEVAALVEEMAKRPELKILLSASRDISKEDLEFVNQLVQKMAKK